MRHADTLGSATSGDIKGTVGPDRQIALIPGSAYNGPPSPPTKALLCLAGSMVPY